MPLFNTAIKFIPGFNNFMQMGAYLYYIRFAYGLNTSQTLGYPPKTKLSDCNALLLHIDYNKDNFRGSENIASVRKQTHQESLGH
jgi:hypothetical protein